MDTIATPASCDGATTSATTARPPSTRVLSVDVLRGLTIALMILVNDPGDWSHVYSQLDHAPWNGFTLTDFVFPSFLFLVGISIVLSTQARMARGNCRATLTGHIFRRAATIFAIKMFLTAFPHFHWTHLRIFGVLTRIAACYLVAGLICLAVWNSRRRAAILVAITATLLIGYWALLRFVPVPGLGMPGRDIPFLDPHANLAAWLDRGFNTFTQHWLHTGSLYNHDRDPEGLVTTLPAIATTLLGAISGLYLTSVEISRNAKALLFVRYGVLFAALGLVWSRTFPLNKNLWTSSYVLFSAGLSLLLLALFYWSIDIRSMNESRAGKALLWPWLVFGSNAITAFVLSNFIVELAIWIKVPAGPLVNPANPSAHISAWLWAYRHLFARHDSTNITSLAFGLAFTALCFLPNWILWRRRIFLKV
ncbi:MAG TPA: heparan-alpha-glucosaminide N-acetyltransferase domain-containing protein [Acidobacteriaceae bacterium]|nr:heparan-alpha-glucosaminide N-acetyltransferase domain-containing protein [Acidobacteriaceae bacterium]